jgi:hypothetical protein
MLSIEEAIVDTLQRRGPCCLEDVRMSLPNVSRGEVFLAVDRMSRHGRVSLLQLGDSTYQITLRAQFGQLASATSQKGM